MKTTSAHSWKRLGASLLLVFGGAFAMAFAPAGARLDLSWHTVDGGGGSPGNGASVGGTFSLSGTIGQPDATPGNVLAGGSYVLVGGFWAAPSAPVTPCPADLNGDGAIDGADLGLLLGNWGIDGLGDLNGDNFVDGADLGLLLGAWGDCPP